MKTFQLLFAASLMMGSILFFSGCDERSCQDVACPTGSTCVSGTCVCNYGYEGTNCDIRTKDKYLGNNYQVFETCVDGANNQTSNNYTTFITDGSYQWGIVINNMLGQGIQIIAEVSGDEIIIPDQNIPSGQIAGQGFYTAANNHITIDYQYTFGGQTKFCDNVQFFKQ